MGLHNRDEVAVLHMGLHARSLREQVGMGRLEEDEPREVVVANDSHHDENSNRHEEVVSVDGNRLDEDYSHEVGVVRDRSSRLKVGDHRDGMVVEIESDNDRCVELPLESIKYQW